MYLSNYKQSTIQHFDCSKFLHGNFRLRPLSSPVTSILSFFSSSLKEGNRTSFPFVGRHARENFSRGTLATSRVLQTRACSPFPRGEREKRKRPRGTARSTPQEYRVAAHVRTSLLGCWSGAGRADFCRLAARSLQFALHLLQIGFPSFLARAHADGGWRPTR